MGKKMAKNNMAKICREIKMAESQNADNKRTDD